MAAEVDTIRDHRDRRPDAETPQTAFDLLAAGDDPVELIVEAAKHLRMERGDEARAVVERARELDGIDDRNAEAAEPRNPVQRLEALEGMQLDHVGARRRIPAERDQGAEVGRGSPHARLVRETDAVDRDALDRLDGEHVADGMPVPVEYAVGVLRVLGARGAGEDAGLHVALLETRLVAEEPERAATEGRIEDRVGEAELQHRGPDDPSAGSTRPGLEEQCVERDRARPDQQEHEADDGEVDRVLGAGRIVRDEVSGAAVADDAGDEHRPDQGDAGRSRSQAERQHRAADQLREHRDARLHGGHRPFVFYDGPAVRDRPAALRPPRRLTLKDIVPRYWTMRGYRVERRFGWDTHGLPIEMEMERELGLSGRSERARRTGWTSSTRPAARTC
jgi:hypothetical protein